MENNFLENYKKKSNQDLQDISEKIEVSEEIDIEISDASENLNETENPTSEMNFTQKSTFKPPRKQNHKNTSQKKFPIISVIIGALAVIGAIILVLNLNSGVTVPDMTGWTETEAKLWGTENEVLIRVETVFDDVIEADKVMSQSPASGEEIAQGNFLEITVSDGPDLDVMVKVPDILNMTMSEVEAWAEENLMTKVRITSEESETVESGKVITFTVNDNTVIGEEIKRDTPLYVTFSKGKPTGLPVELPDFTTMTVEEAQTFATDNGIVLEIVEEFSDTAPKDTIIKQSIKAEEVIKSGETVTLNVSKGKEIIIPNFGQFSKDIVSTKASQLGITVVLKERYSNSSADAFLSQSKAAGSLYEEDDIIELTYSLGNSVVLSSYVGSSVDTVHSWAQPLNESGANIKINVRYTASDTAAGTVLSQDKENVTISINETINLVVSSGGIVFVPDLVADPGAAYADIMTRERVIAICDSLGIVPIFIEEAQADRLPGEVWYQSIEPGQQIEQGSTIEVKYTPLNQTHSVPDFSGLTRLQIEASGYHMMFSITYSEGDYQAGMEDKATGQSISAGTTVAAGTDVEIILGAQSASTTPTPAP